MQEDSRRKTGEEYTDIKIKTNGKTGTKKQHEKEETKVTRLSESKRE